MEPRDLKCTQLASMQREETGGGLQVRRQWAAGNNSTQWDVNMLERAGSVFFDFPPYDGWH